MSNFLSQLFHDAKLYTLKKLNTLIVNHITSIEPVYLIDLYEAYSDVIMSSDQFSQDRLMNVFISLKSKNFDYRVVRRITDDGETSWSVNEVLYDEDNQPIRIGELALPLSDDETDFYEQLAIFVKAYDKPYLTPEDLKPLEITIDESD